MILRRPELFSVQTGWISNSVVYAKKFERNAMLRVMVMTILTRTRMVEMQGMTDIKLTDYFVRIAPWHGNY